jgi:polysaccharide biosynthesis protein VpsP
MKPRVLLPFVAGGLLLAGIYAAAVRGLADMAYYPARRAMTQWTLDKRVPSATEWDSTQAYLERAAALAPSNPLYVEELGRLFEQRAVQAYPRDPAARALPGEARALLERSRAQFRRAASMRPGSPYAWSSLALVKFRLGEMDFEFYGALERAARFGPWEPAVQLALADIGLAGWRWLALPGKLAVLGAIERAMKRQDGEIGRLAKLHPDSAAFCADPLVRARGLLRHCPPL